MFMPRVRRVEGSELTYGSRVFAASKDVVSEGDQEQMSLDKVVYTAHAVATGGRAGIAKTDDGKLDVKLDPPQVMGGGGRLQRKLRPARRWRQRVWQRGGDEGAPAGTSTGASRKAGTRRARGLPLLQRYAGQHRRKPVRGIAASFAATKPRCLPGLYCVSSRSVAASEGRECGGLGAV